jgi:branched-chain amino acid transport system permease protein
MSVVIISGISIGIIYGLIALGFSMVYRMTGVLNFAHGDLLMVGGLIGYTSYTVWKLPFVVTILISAVVVGLLMVIIERLALRPVKYLVIPCVVITMGVSFILQNIAQMIWGKGGFSFPSVISDMPVDFIGIPVIPQYLVLFGIGILVVLVLSWFMIKTKSGVAMRATAGDQEMATLNGVNVYRSNSIAFFISGGLAGIAGVLMAPITLLSATMGVSLALVGFVAALLGGLGNLVGAIVGGIVLGLVEVLSATYLSANYRLLIVYGFLTIILILKPSGLFGDARGDS